MYIYLCIRCYHFMLPFSAKSGVPLGGGGGGGRCSSPLASLRVIIHRRRSPVSAC